MKDGHTVCWECLRTVKVRKGLVGYHVTGTYGGRCEAHGQPARWVEKRALIAMMRNPAGNCMACKQHVSDGHNEDCPQCGLPEDWARREHG